MRGYIVTMKVIFGIKIYTIYAHNQQLLIYLLVLN